MPVSCYFLQSFVRPRQPSRSSGSRIVLAVNTRNLLHLPGWHCAQTQLGRRGPQRVNSEGDREILSMCKGAKEDSGWSAHSSNILRSATSTAFGLIISDAVWGLSRAQPSSPRCGLARLCRARVTEVREIAAMLRAIYAGENIVAAGEAREVSFNRFLGLPSARRRVRALAQAWRQAVG
jgi:hypothetical protein